MKKFTYLLAVAAVFTACNSGNNGYTVTGTVEGAADGDTVYLETVEGRQFVKLDSAVIKDGTFTFKGTQDTAVNRYISYKAEGKDGAAIDFFLENGKIKINLSQENNSATGTANNDAYQEIRVQINGLNKQMMTIYESMSDTTLTDEQREAKSKEMENLENSMISAIKAGINKNITNPVGVLLLKQNYYYMDVADLDPLMPQIPAAYDNDEAIVKIKSNVEKMKATAVGQKFTDFEMQTPEGRMYPVELDVAAACIIKFGKQKFVAGSNIIRQKPDVGVNGFYLSPLHTLNNLGHNLCRRRDMLFFHHPSVHNGIKKCEFFQNRMP